MANQFDGHKGRQIREIEKSPELKEIKLWYDLFNEKESSALTTLLDNLNISNFDIKFKTYTRGNLICYEKENMSKAVAFAQVMKMLPPCDIPDASMTCKQCGTLLRVVRNDRVSLGYAFACCAPRGKNKTSYFRTRRHLFLQTQISRLMKP